MYTNYQPDDVQSTTPPDELDSEAQRLIDMFYEKMAFQSTELRRHEIAKQCAIIHCDLMYDKLTELLKSDLHNDFGIMAERVKYMNLKQKIKLL